MSNPDDRAALFEMPSGDDDGGEGRSRIGLIAAIIGGVLVLILLVGVAVFFLLGMFQEVAEQRQSNIPALLPADTQMYGTITPALSDIPNVARLQGNYPQLFVDQNPEVANEQLADLGVTFQEDIQPWIGGEVAFAIGGITDFTALNDPTGGLDESELYTQADLVILLASRDDEAAWRFLEKVRTNLGDEGAEFVEVTHNEVVIYEQTNPAQDEPPLAFSVAGGNVVFANHAEAIIAILDRAANAEGESLANSASFQRLRENQPENAIGYIYVDGALIADANRQSVQQARDQLPEGMVEYVDRQVAILESFEALGLSMAVESQGVALDAVATMNLDQLDESAMAILSDYSQPVDPARLERISDEALMLNTFSLPANLKEQFLEGFNAEPGGEEALAEFNQQVGIDLEQDVLNWLAGEGSLVVLPGEQMGDFEIPATGYMALSSPNLDAASNGMQNITGALEQQFEGFVLFEPATIANTEWQVLQSPMLPPGDPAVGYAIVGEDLIIAFGNRSMQAAVNGSDNPITAEPRFQTVLDALASPNTGVFYADMAATLELFDTTGVSAEIPTDEELVEAEEVRRNLEPLRALGGATQPALDETGVVHLRLFFYIEEPESDPADEPEAPTDEQDAPVDEPVVPEGEPGQPEGEGEPGEPEGEPGEPEGEPGEPEGEPGQP